MKKLKNRMKNIILYLAVPMLLFSFWVISLLYFVPNNNFFTITYDHSIDSINNYSQNKIFKGKKLSGQITSKEDNLGTIYINFAPLRYLKFEDKGDIFFRIKEENSNSWDFENKYSLDAIKASNFFPFGFPIYSNSKNKRYIFELDSTQASEQKSLALETDNFKLKSYYVFNKNKVLSSSSSLIIFLNSKARSVLMDQKLVLISMFYLLPLTMYLVILFLKRLKNQNKIKLDLTFNPNRFILMHLAFLSIIINIFFNLNKFNNLIYVCLIFIWLYCLRRYRLDNSVTFLYAILLFMFALFGIIIGDSRIIQNSSNWMYFLLVIGSLQLLVEVRYKSKLLNYSSYLKKLFYSK